MYDAKPGEDETASAAWAERHLVAAGVDPAATSRVAELVMTTLTHTFADEDVLATLLSDADLAVLGADEATYDAYVETVRAEYTAVPQELWVLGRRHVLEQLLAKDRLFATPTAYEQWERKARANVQRELLSLST